MFLRLKLRSFVAVSSVCVRQHMCSGISQMSFVVHIPISYPADRLKVSAYQNGIWFTFNSAFKLYS